MKQAILNLKKKLLLVELPEGTIDEPEYIATICMVPKDYWKLIGKPTDIKEEQFSEWVENNSMGCYDNYKGIVDNKYTCLTAKESFFSYLEKEGIWFENPLGSESEYVKTLLKSIGFKYNPGYGSWDNDKYGIGTPLLITDLPPSFDKEKKEWQEAESKVWQLLTNLFI